MTNWAITIGINHYDHLRRLKYAQQDTESMGDLLSQTLGFEEVFLFTDNSPPIEAKPKNIETRPTFGTLTSFLERQFGDPESKKPPLGSGDNLWFFFAGHGQLHDGVDYLMMSDSNPRNPKKTAIDVNFVTQQLQNCGADNIVLFLDTCRDELASRGGTRGIDTTSYPGVIIFYSCQPNERSWEIDEPVNQGSFTHILMKVLRGETGQDCNTVQQVDDYLREQVPLLNKEYDKPIQSPVLANQDRQKQELILLPWYAREEGEERSTQDPATEPNGDEVMPVTNDPKKNNKCTFGSHSHFNCLRSMVLSSTIT